MVKRYTTGRHLVLEYPTGELVAWSDYAALEARCRVLDDALKIASKIRSKDDANRIAELESALKVIASYDPGKFRPLEDEIAIHKIATTALRGPAGYVSEAPTTFLEDVMEHDSEQETVCDDPVDAKGNPLPEPAPIGWPKTVGWYCGCGHLNEAKWDSCFDCSRDRAATPSALNRGVK